MIEQHASPSPIAAVEFLLRPNRSASARGLAAFFGLLAGVSVAVAAVSASFGNWLAPPFAAVELLVVAACLRLVWMRQGRHERIALTQHDVRVVGDAEGAARDARFDPYWVRVVDVPGRTRLDRTRLLLTSHGRAVEVGAFLADGERAALGRELRRALATLQQARRYTDMERR